MKIFGFVMGNKNTGGTMTDGNKNNQAKYHAELKDKSKVQITKDATHYRAHNAAGAQVGEAYIKLEDLLNSIGAKLIEK